MITAEAIEACTIKGRTELPPVAGQFYVAFTVHPPCPGPVVLAIAHREGEMRIVDAIRESITIADAAVLLRRYGISGVTGAESEGEGDDVLHAVAGAVWLLRGTLQ